MADPTRESFRTYLESSGVIEALNRVMADLNELEEKPADVLAYVREAIGAPPYENVDALIRENQDITARVARLRAELAALDAR